VQNDYQVTVTGIENDIIESIQNSSQSHLSAYYLNCLTDPVIEKISELIKMLGGLDLLVLSAGIGNLNKDLGYEVENKANKLNVLVFTAVIDWSYRFFEQQGHGHLVAFTSVSGLFGSRVAPAYHAAKAYQISYLQGMRQKAFRARKEGKLVYITDVRPGFVATNMTTGKKMIWVATKEKAANQIFTLINNKSSFGYISRRWRISGILVKILPSWVRNRL
jgi:short-subunit dehydrogenase